MKRIIQTFLIVIALLISFPLYAADFQADYDTQYAVSPTGTTIVTHNVTLTNKQSNIYPKQYMITIDSDQIKNVIAYDSKGVITPHIVQKDKKTEITVTFNDQVVGIDKKLLFTLRYENYDIAKKLGNIWEIRIPGITADPTLGEYTVSLQTPTSFPQNAYMTPLPATGVRWTKQQLLNGGINAAYGEYQSYGVDILYPLENESLSPTIQTIAIPPDTTYQSVTISSLVPKPKEMKKDGDGNWIASYELGANERLDVSAKLIIKTYIKALSNSEKTLSNLSDYTKAQPYWEVNDAKIQEYAKKLKTPREIYNFVIATLSYNYGHINASPIRKGAVAALTNPANSLCTEFTDLFIAIARAAGIPAREVVGYAYTSDNRLRPLLVGSDILHAWPEYYDTSTSRWIPIDPTWGFTTGGINYFDVLDFNHIAFVIHGISSERPYPAGSFKEGSIPQKNVSVRFSESSNIVIKDTYKTVFDIASSVMGGKTLQGKIQIKNTGSRQIENLSIEVLESIGKIHITKTEQNIPPYGSISIPITIRLPITFSPTQGLIEVVVNGDRSTFTYSITPTYWIYVCILCILSALVLLVWTILRKR